MSETELETMKSYSISFCRAHAAPLSIYKDSSAVDTTSRHQPDMLKSDINSWHTLGSRAERNKENNAMPTKWKAYKVSLFKFLHLIPT